MAGCPCFSRPSTYANVLPHVRRGLARSGRRLSEIDLAACIWCSLSDDQAAAEATLANKIAYYGHAMSPTLLQQLGLSRADFEPIRQAWHIDGDQAAGRGKW